MNRRSLLIAVATILSLAGSLAIRAAGESFETATEAVANMRIGWNLGNTLESNSGDTLNMWIEHWTDRTPTAYETAWGQPVATRELIQMMKRAGFNAVRVPVTWYPHMEARFQFSGYDNSLWLPSQDPLGTQIQTDWMQRVHEVVDYVISQDMYCILNVHHDTGAASTAWLVADEGVYAQQKERFEAVWTQIANEFRDYDEHLLFEGYNEMLDTPRSWCFASYAAPGQYNAAIARSAYNAINSYAQSFVDAVRATGGNNAQRNLIVSTYGACSGSGTWNSHLQDPLKQMKLPTDEATGHLIFEIHSYLDVKNLTSAKNEVSQMLRDAKANLASKGAPVIFGEWGSTTEDAYDKYRSNLLAFARYFVEQTKAYGMGTFYWMGLSDGAHRSVPEFNQADLKDAIVKGWYGEEGYTGLRTVGADADRQPAVRYDLSGRRLPARDATGRPAIVIVDGRKVVSRRK